MPYGYACMLTRFAYTCKAIYCPCWGEHLFVHHVPGVKTLHTKSLASQHRDGNALLKEEASLLPTRESVTYSWPWENIGLGRYRPMYWSVWPWALLMVSERRLYGELASQLEWLRLIIGDQLYAWNEDVLTLVVTVACKACVRMCLMTKMACPADWSRLRIMIGMPTFSLSWWGGRPSGLTCVGTQGGSWPCV